MVGTGGFTRYRDALKHQCFASEHQCFASEHQCFASEHQCSVVEHQCSVVEHQCSVVELQTPEAAEAMFETAGGWAALLEQPEAGRPC
ncbi:MAG: hypothetical protein LBD24_08640 [Spirochaetaceae bacterium]|nr:hypothetical protein [Spirochaetaceae bacterium]